MTTREMTMTDWLVTGASLLQPGQTVKADMMTDQRGVVREVLLGRTTNGLHFWVDSAGAHRDTIAEMDDLMTYLLRMYPPEMNPPAPA